VSPSLDPARLVDWLAATPWSIALHESQYAYTYIETAHVLAITLFVGTIAMVDLRLLGLGWRAVPVSPWTVAGFILMTLTGLLLFYAIPVRTYYSLWFRLKVILLATGAINIWVFHQRVQRDRERWDGAAVPPLAARVSAAVSLLVWAGVIVTGRMIAYNWFDCDKPLSHLVRTLTGCPVGGI
jgi:hypothetical protein